MTDELVTQVVSIAGLDGRFANRRLFARLDAVSLAELVQLNGQRADRSVYRVTSGAMNGYLFFAAGHIHAARFGDATGLEAIALMLSLETGAFEACDEAWPGRGNVQLPTPTALLRASQIREAREQEAEPRGAPLRGARNPARSVVRTVDSLLLHPTIPGGPARDPELESFTLSFYEQARKLGDALGLTRLAAARLADDLWLFLLYHDSHPERLSAALGSRQRAGADAVHQSIAPARRPTRSLADSSDRDGILGAFIGGPLGEPLASQMPSRLCVDDVSRVLSLCEQLLCCSQRVGFRATGSELRFAGRRVVITRSSDGLVGVVAVSSVSVSWVRELVVRLMQRISADEASSSNEALPRG